MDLRYLRFAVIGLNILSVVIMMHAGDIEPLSEMRDLFPFLLWFAPAIAVLLLYNAYRMHLTVALLSALSCFMMAYRAGEDAEIGQGIFHIFVVVVTLLICVFILIGKAWRMIVPASTACRWRL